MLVGFVAPFGIVASAVVASWLHRATVLGYAHAALPLAGVFIGTAVVMFTPVYSAAIVGAFGLTAVGMFLAASSRRVRTRIVA